MAIERNFRAMNKKSAGFSVKEKGIFTRKNFGTFCLRDLIDLQKQRTDICCIV